MEKGEIIQEILKLTGIIDSINTQVVWKQHDKQAKAMNPNFLSEKFSGLQVDGIDTPCAASYDNVALAYAEQAVKEIEAIEEEGQRYLETLAELFADNYSDDELVQLRVILASPLYRRMNSVIVQANQAVMTDVSEEGSSP